MITELLHRDDRFSTPVKEWSGTQEGKTWRILNGSAKEALQLIPKASVNCIITSPPYFWLRDYKVDNQIGLENTVDGYVVAVKEVMHECFELLHEEGVLFLNLGDTYYSGKGESQGKDKKSSKRRFGLRAVDKSGGLGIGLQRKSIIGVPWRVAISMCQDNWILRSPIIWNRVSCLPEAAKDRPSRSYEYVFMFVKSRRYYFDKSGLPSGGGNQDLWNIAPRIRLNGAVETAPFPDELVEQCLAIGCPPNGIVLDPFCGSGTTVRVSLKNGFHSIGIDLNEKFCRYSVENIAGIVK